MIRLIKYLAPMLSFSAFVFLLIIVFDYIEFSLASFVLGCVLTIVFSIALAFNRVDRAEDDIKNMNNFK